MNMYCIAICIILVGLHLYRNINKTNLLSDIFFVVCSLPAVFLACLFTIGDPTYLQDRFRKVPFLVIGGRLLVCVITLFIIIVLSLLLWYLVEKYRRKEQQITIQMCLKHTADMFLYGFLYAITILLQEFLITGYIV